MLRSHDDAENEGKKWSLDEAGTGASETPDEGVEFSGSSDEPSRIGSPVQTTDDDSSVHCDKRLEQGWMWGWTTPDNLKDTGNLSGSPYHSGAKGQNSSPRRTVDISKSWRARAAEAMSRRLGETTLQGKVDSMPAMTDGSSRATPSQAVGEESHLLNLSGSNANRNLVQRLILFFLIQTFNVRLMGSSVCQYTKDACVSSFAAGLSKLLSVVCFATFRCELCSAFRVKSCFAHL